MTILIGIILAVSMTMAEQQQIPDERRRLLAMLLRILTDPELTRQRQASGDPWTFKAPNATWPNMRFYQDKTRMQGDIARMAKRFPDPKLAEAFLDSLRRGGKTTLEGFFDRPTNTVFAPYESDATEHELEHFFYPEEQHPLFETLDEWRAKKKKRGLDDAIEKVLGDKQ